MFNFLKSLKFNLFSLIFYFILIGFSFLIGFFINQYLFNNKIISKQENHEPGFKHISPLLECLNTSAVDYKNNKIGYKIQDLIKQEIAKKNVNHVSIYIRDLSNGPWIGFNEKEKFSPASLMKVPLLISFLKLAEINPEVLNKKVTIDQNQDSEGLEQNIVPLNKVEYGKTYTIGQLLNYMIEYSDNLATNTLLNNIDQNFLNKIYSDLNLNMPTENTENYMNVYDYASFFRILYNSTYLSREMSEYALSLLTKSTFRNGIVAGVPSNIEVSHKFGERVLADNTKQLHDCGIVYRKNSSYLICIMTRGDDFDKMESSIQNFSKLIYDNF